VNNKSSRDTLPLAPKYWPVWLGLGVLRLLNLLPYRWQLSLGKGLGGLLRRVAKSRRHVVETNLRLCFPELDEAAREQLLRKHFESMGIMFFELGLGWWASHGRLKKLTTVEGLENLESALETGRGALLLGAHYTTMDISGRLLATQTHIPLRCMYRPHENPVLDYVIRRGRESYLDKSIPRDDIRGLVRTLRENKVVWYASDQAYQGKGYAMVPFFGVPAATNTGTSRIAKMSKTKVLPFVSIRQEDGSGYLLKILPPLEDFPSNDEVADATRIHQLMEAQIRQHPAQYFWVHRRFKLKRSREKDVYSQVKN